jgi:hypothetical protein
MHVVPALILGWKLNKKRLMLWLRARIDPTKPNLQFKTQAYYAFKSSEHREATEEEIMQWPMDEDLSNLYYNGENNPPELFSVYVCDGFQLYFLDMLDLGIKHSPCLMLDPQAITAALADEPNVARLRAMAAEINGTPETPPKIYYTSEEAGY